MLVKIKEIVHMIRISHTITIAIALLLNTGTLQGQDTTSVIPPLRLIPGDTLLYVGESIQFQSIFTDTSTGETNQVEPEKWSISGNSSGTISPTGLFEGLFPTRNVRVTAIFGSDTASAFVTVEKNESDSSGYNTIAILKPNPGKGKNKKQYYDYIDEGEYYKINGFDGPLKILNGSRIYFPIGSLDQDIVLDIHVPEFAKVKDDSLVFGSDILSGLAFHVYVDSVLQSPYEFNIPVNIMLVVPPGQLKKMGITAEQLTMVFVDEDMTFDSTGISEVLADGPTNRIFASVEHFSTLGAVEAANMASDSLSIKNDNIIIAVGDSVELSAVYKPGPGSPIDTVFSWSVVPDSLGTINATGLLTAMKIGAGKIYAGLGTLVDSIEINVVEQSTSTFTVLPADTTVILGNDVQYVVILQDGDLSEYIDSTSSWWLPADSLVGSISDSGLVHTHFRGTGLVYFEIEHSITHLKHTAFTSVTVIDTTTDEINEISIYRYNSPQDTIPRLKRLNEGSEYVMAGLQGPLKVLNASRFNFPLGSLKNDIEIELRLPERAKVFGSDSVDFGESILSGFSANVLVNDSLISPFVFEKPITISIPYRKGLLAKYGLEAEDLGMFYETDSAEFDTEGIQGTIVVESSNMVISQVAHFSTLLVGDVGLLTIASVDEDAPLPTQFSLKQNYPNPFNPSTTIEYHLPKEANVTLTIYDMLGREVARLGDELQSAGIRQVVWHGRTGNGRQVASGIYFARLAADDFTATVKLVLLK